MLLELGLVATDDLVVGMPAGQLNSRGCPVARAPVGIRLRTVVPRAVAIPDAPGIVGRPFERIHSNTHARVPRNDFPRFTGEELAMAQAIEQVPDRVLHRKLTNADDLQTALMAAQQVVLAV